MALPTKHPLATFLLLVAVALSAVSCRPAAQTCDTGVADGNQADGSPANHIPTPPVTLNAGEDKPKILMLHGGGGSAAGFARQRGMRAENNVLIPFSASFLPRGITTQPRGTNEQLRGSALTDRDSSC